MQIGRLDPRALGLDQRRQALVQNLVAQATGQGGGGGVAGGVGTAFRGPMGPRFGGGGHPLITQMGGGGIRNSILAQLGLSAPRSLTGESSGAPGQDISQRAQQLAQQLVGGPPQGQPVPPAPQAPQAPAPVAPQAPQVAPQAQPVDLGNGYTWDPYTQQIMASNAGIGAGGAVRGLSRTFAG